MSTITRREAIHELVVLSHASLAALHSSREHDRLAGQRLRWDAEGGFAFGVSQGALECAKEAWADMLESDQLMREYDALVQVAS